MFKPAISLYNANQTRILLCAACFALITNIATMVVLFEQLEHESLCDQQNEFNEFVESIHPPLQTVQKNHQIIIPKPKLLKHPPTTTTTAKPAPRLPIKQADTELEEEKESSILDYRGGAYVRHEFEPSEIKATDWKYYLDLNIPKLHSECNHKNYASHIFMNALSKWIWMREYGWFPQYDCPLYVQTEYRPIDLVPHIYPTQCAPFWPSDVVYLLSEILNPSMMAIQYGFSLSSLWIANFVDTLNVVDSRKNIIKQNNQLLMENGYDMSNIELEWQRMSKRYVERVDPKKGKIVDVVVMDTVPEYHDDVLKYIVSVLKEDNGILLIKLSDEEIPDNMDQLINELIPKHWLRYDSFLPDFLAQSISFSQEQYLEQYNVSIWITRPRRNPCGS
eukprot:18873_1